VSSILEHLECGINMKPARGPQTRFFSNYCSGIPGLANYEMLNEVCEGNFWGAFFRHRASHPSHGGCYAYAMLCYAMLLLAFSPLLLSVSCRDQLPAMLCNSGARGNSRCKLTAGIRRQPCSVAVALHQLFGVIRFLYSAAL
jgi:hypothetical protein